MGVSGFILPCWILYGLKTVMLKFTSVQVFYSSVQNHGVLFYSPAKVSHKQWMDIDMGVYFQQTPNRQSSINEAIIKL